MSWRNESRRHSLASRGISTTSTLNPEQKTLSRELPLYVSDKKISRIEDETIAKHLEKNPKRFTDGDKQPKHVINHTIKELRSDKSPGKTYKFGPQSKKYLPEAHKEFERLLREDPTILHEIKRVGPSSFTFTVSNEKPSVKKAFVTFEDVGVRKPTGDSANEEMIYSTHHELKHIEQRNINGDGKMDWEVRNYTYNKRPHEIEADEHGKRKLKAYKERVQ